MLSQHNVNIIHLLFLSSRAIFYPWQKQQMARSKNKKKKKEKKKEKKKGFSVRRHVKEVIINPTEMK